MEKVNEVSVLMALSKFGYPNTSIKEAVNIIKQIDVVAYLGQKERRFCLAHYPFSVQNSVVLSKEEFDRLYRKLLRVVLSCHDLEKPSSNASEDEINQYYYTAIVRAQTLSNLLEKGSDYYRFINSKTHNRIRLSPADEEKHLAVSKLMFGAFDAVSVI